jgi:hypothetical protein
MESSSANTIWKHSKFFILTHCLSIDIYCVTTDYKKQLIKTPTFLKSSFLLLNYDANIRTTDFENNRYTTIKLGLFFIAFYCAKKLTMI